MSKKKNAVSFAKPPEPAFLRRIKEQIGYREGPSVDTKREELPACEDDDLEDRNDERPTVVVLKPGDLTQDEAEKLNAFEDEGEPGKVVFRKPVKRSAEEMEKDTSTNTSTSTSKVKPVPIRREDSNVKKVKNKSLLSFDEEEDDDE